MSNLIALTRREFVHRGLVVVSTAATMPAFIQHSALALSDPMDLELTRSRPGVPEDRVLVVVQLSGGNDGLNSVVPYGAGEYYDARPGIAVSEKAVLRLGPSEDGKWGGGIGLHPSLADLKGMFDDGLASVLQGVGYPNPNRSHFASMDIWHTCQAHGHRGVGWLGKALEQIAPEQATSMIAIGAEAPLAGRGQGTQPVSFENVNLFRWAGRDLHKSLGRWYDRIHHVDAIGHPSEGEDEFNQAAFVRRTALDAQVVSQRVRSAVNQGTVTDFPGGQLADQLRMVASMIRAELPTRIYYVGLGGFDTHAAQLGRHANLLRQFASAMRGFYKELRAMGQDGRVLSVAFSEFGRRVGQNASRGTDHGTAGPMYFFGPMVKPGLLGRHPSLSQLDNGDLIHSVDFRSVYAAILDGWMKCDSRKVLGRSFKPADVLSSAV